MTLGFSDSSQYLIEDESLKAYEQGGGTKNIFWHDVDYAVVQLCVVEENVTPPKCNPLRTLRTSSSSTTSACCASRSSHTGSCRSCCLG